MENLWHFPCSLPPQAFLSILVIYLLASYPEVILTFLAPHCGVLYTFLTYISLGAEFKCGGHTELKKFYFSKHVKKKKKSFGIFGSLVETTDGGKEGQQILPLTDGLDIINADTYHTLN